MGKAVSIFRRFISRIGHRGAFLLFIALLDFLYGYSIFIASHTQSSINLLIPWDVWGTIWTVTGVILLQGAFAIRDRVHYGVAATLMASWAGVWVKLWLYQGIPNAWVNVVLWSAFAGIITVVSSWPEVRRHRRHDPDEELK